MMRRALRGRGRWRVPASALVTLALGLLATATLFSSIRSLEYQRLQADFERRAAYHIAAVRLGLEEAVDGLTTINRLFMTMQPVGRAQFESFTRPMLKNHPQFQLVAYQRLVAHDERAGFEAARRSEFPGFTITELQGSRLVPAAPRPAYRVVDYLVPLAGNQMAHGLDATSRPEQDEAVRRACASGEAAITGQYPVLLGNAQRPGFMLLMPVYRRGAALAPTGSNCALVTGYTTLAFTSAALVEQTPANYRLLRPGEFDIRLYAAGGPDPAQLVFHARPAAGSGPPWLATLFGARAAPVTATFEVAGQSWHLALAAGAPSLLEHGLASLLTLAGGVLGSLLAAAYIGMLVARSHSVQRKVEKRTAALQHANQSLQLRQQAIEACVDSIIITSADGPDYPIEYVNPAFVKMNGYSAAEVTGRSCALLWERDYGQRGVRDILALVRARRAGQAVLRTRRKDGSVAWCEMHIAPFRDADGAPRHYVVVQHDITEKRRYESELEFQATHDTLTGLANRKLLRTRLQHEIAGAARQRHSVWVLFVGIDRFKFVNDSVGHRAGDEFLQAIAARLCAAVRPGDTVARHGGDEFVLVLPEPGPMLGGQALERIMEAIAQPLTVAGHEFFPSGSVGLAGYPDHGEDPDTLIEFADLAMHEAKQRGRNGCQYYVADMNRHAQERLQLEHDLRNALERAEFEMYYQPQADLRSGRIAGIEALLRWHHPVLGLVTPERFLGLAEETGLIVPIGAWFLRTACVQARAWQQAGLGELRIALNLGARQLKDPALVRLVEQVLVDSALPAHCLQLELTESLVMDDLSQALDVLSGLRALGVQLAIDNFGTGYSSLVHLKRFPIDVLKIDRSFVREISQRANDAAISDAIISIAHSLGMRVIAEGVDSEAQCEFLSRNMCDEIQGTLFALPLAGAQMQAMLERGACLPEHLLRLAKRARTLLLVDDEPNILAALKRQMRGAGYRILTAPSGQDGLALLAAEEVDVILSDQRMPGMTGVEFLRAVKNSHPETVRMVLSGFTELQSVTDAVNEGAIYKFLTKPWDDTQLRSHIEEAFRHKEMADDNRRLGLEVRTANHGLAQANRQLEEVLRQQQEQIKRDNISLQIVREALQHVPLAILGLDEEQVVAFANTAAQALFRDHGLLLGNAAEQFMPAVLAALQGVADGLPCVEDVGGVRFEIVAHSMGRATSSRGQLITFTPITALPGETT